MTQRKKVTISMRKKEETNCFIWNSVSESRNFQSQTTWPVISTFDQIFMFLMKWLQYITYIISLRFLSLFFLSHTHREITQLLSLFCLKNLSTNVTDCKVSPILTSLQRICFVACLIFLLSSCGQQSSNMQHSHFLVVNFKHMA